MGLLNAWDFIDSNGLVSDGCMPYSSAQGDVAACPAGGCSTSESPTTFKCPVAHSMLDSDEEIQAAVMVAGAVEVGFYVYEDFMNYKSGIYKHEEGQVLGGHAVKIVGWGHQGTQFYWIVQNSWGASWAKRGFSALRIGMTTRILPLRSVGVLLASKVISLLLRPRRLHHQSVRTLFRIARSTIRASVRRRATLCPCA